MTTSFDVTKPDDHTLNSQWPQEVREVKELLKSALFYDATQPTTRPDGTAFEANDNGSLWIDSDDNQVYVLTDYSVPTWVSISAFLSAISITMADPTLTIQNTDEENTDGGRQSQINFKGEQDGGEVTTLARIEVSHDSPLAEDDEKGQITIKLNDGDDGNSPSKQAIGYMSTGKIDVANSLSVLDEDDMDSDDDECVPTQQSVKKYVDDQVDTKNFGVYTNEDDDSTAMLKAHAYLANQDGYVTAIMTADGAGRILNGYIGATSDPAGAGDLIQSQYSFGNTYKYSISFPVASGKYFEITDSSPNATSIYWHPVGTLVKPTDQEP